MVASDTRISIFEDMDKLITYQTFKAEKEVESWNSVNDVVMGGVSTGKMVWKGQASASFVGIVSFENSGGFASVKTELPTGTLSGAGGIFLRAKGDGKLYSFRLYRTDGPRRYIYAQEFAARPEWHTFELDFAGFHPVRKGQPDPAAPPLDPAKLSAWGLLIARQEGPFELQVSEMGMISPEAPHQ